MNSDCNKIRDYIADFVSGTLTQEQAQVLEEHLQQCPACNGYAQALKQEDLLLTKLFDDISTDMKNRQQEILKAIDRSPPVNQSVNVSVWRTIMRSRITKLAAAAVVVVAAIVGIHQFGRPLVGGTVSFAQVIQPILNARSAMFDIVVGEERQDTPIIHDMIIGSRIRRTMSNVSGVVSIIDLESSKILVLTESSKEAVYIDFKGLPPIPNYIDRLRNLIAKLQEHPEFTVEELGQKEIAGQKLIGFRAKHPKAELTIWADPHTALPVRIETTEGQLNTICKNMQFDVPMDDSMFSMEVPEGYKQQQTQIDLQGSTEQDFIEGLRIRAELLGDGQYPDGVAVEDYIKQAPAIGKKIEEMKLAKEKETELGMNLSKHLLFIRFFKGEGNWQYAGKGVKLGDANKPIFWYRPKDSQTYRVIYGDLRVEDVAPENLPQ